MSVKFLVYIFLMLSAPYYAQSQVKGVTKRATAETPIVTVVPTTDFTEKEDVKIQFEKNMPIEYTARVTNKKSKKIIISGINRKLYTIEENKVEKDLHTTVPGAISGMKLPSFLSMGGIAKVSEPVMGMLPGENDVNKSTYEALNKSIPETFEAIKKKAKQLNESAILFNKITNLSNECSNTTEEIKTKSNELVSAFLYGTGDLSIREHAQLYITLKAMLYGLREEAEGLYIKLTDDIPTYKKATSTLYANEDKSVDNQLQNETKERDAAKNAETKKTHQDNIDDLENRKKILAKDKAQFEEEIKSVETDLEEAEKLIEAMFEFEKANNIQSLLSLYNLIHSQAFSTYTAYLPKAKKDLTTYTFSITPKELLPCTEIDKLQLEVKIETVGGIKFDFSSGIFVNIGNDDFLGRTYYYKKTGADTREIVSAERGNRLMLSLGALMHIYKRTAKPVKPAFSVGVSTTADFETANFHVGPSLILGKENRFILTAGLTLKTSTILDRQLEMGKVYNVADTPDDIPTVATFPKAGGFLALTYNFTRFGKGE